MTKLNKTSNYRNGQERRFYFIIMNTRKKDKIFVTHRTGGRMKT